MIFDSFKADLKFIVRNPMLLLASIAPFFLIIILRFVFPFLSDFIFEKTEFQPGNYYAIVAITMICVIPMIFGMVYAFILIDENDLHILESKSVTPAGVIKFLYMRMMVLAFLSFIMVLFSILITNPVPTEGWLRILIISLLLSIQSPFCFLFIGSLAGSKVGGLALSKLFGIFLVAVPLGLILHHPWNYIAFFSPMYWISWAWITPSPLESLTFGGISLILSIGCILIFFRHFLKKHSN